MLSSNWDNSLKIGIPLIDLQHEQLIRHLDKLVDVLQNNSNDRSLQKNEIKQVIRFLDGYVKTHFNYEEDCMDLYNCPIACDNKQAHECFLTTFKDVKQMLDVGDPSPHLIQKINQELIQWFINHIRQIDTQLKSSMERKDVSRM